MASLKFKNFLKRFGKRKENMPRCEMNGSSSESWEARCSSSTLFKQPFHFRGKNNMPNSKKHPPFYETGSCYLINPCEGLIASKKNLHKAVNVDVKYNPVCFNTRRIIDFLEFYANTRRCQAETPCIPKIDLSHSFVFFPK